MMIRKLSLFSALIALTWSAASSPQESANSCLVNINNDQKQRHHIANTGDSNSTTMAYCSETSDYRNNCDKPIFALFRLSNDNPPSASGKSGIVYDFYLYPDTALAQEHRMNQERFGHICENDYSVVYCAEFVQDRLPPVEIMVQSVDDDTEALESRKLEMEMHFEAHIRQLSVSDCYRAITSDTISSDSAINNELSNFAPLQHYEIIRPFEGRTRGILKGFDINGLLFDPLSELWEKAPRQPHSGENVLILH